MKASRQLPVVKPPFVAVVAPDPFHAESEIVLVPTLGRDMEQVTGAVNLSRPCAMEAQLPSAHGLGTDQRPFGPQLRVRQYTSVAFGKRCREMGVRPSTGSPGYCMKLGVFDFEVSYGRARRVFGW